MPAAIEIDEPRALWFRARRSHLSIDARDPAAAARALLGAQAQQESMALFGLSQRTAGRPTAGELRRLLLPPPRLLRAWGQRDTLHVYDPSDWRDVIASLDAWPRSGRRGGMPPPELLDEARRFFRAAAEPVFRRDLFHLLPAAYVRELRSHPGVGGSAERMAASRLVWLLARQGEVCFAGKLGAEASYAPRRLFFPDLEWPEVSTEDAFRRLIRRYLSTWAPATAADMAHFFGARVGAIKERLTEIEDELATVDCGGRRGLVARAADVETLAEKPPAGGGWPLRLLPQWDAHLMTHKDKSWVVDAAEEKAVWRKAGVVAAAVIARGRVVATWKHKATKTRLVVTVTPLTRWRKKHLPAVKREATAFARHLEVDHSEVVLPPSVAGVPVW